MKKAAEQLHLGAIPKPHPVRLLPKPPQSVQYRGYAQKGRLTVCPLVLHANST